MVENGPAHARSAAACGITKGCPASAVAAVSPGTTAAPPPAVPAATATHPVRHAAPQPILCVVIAAKPAPATAPMLAWRARTAGGTDRTAKTARVSHAPTTALAAASAASGGISIDRH